MSDFNPMAFGTDPVPGHVVNSVMKYYVISLGFSKKPV